MGCPPTAASPGHLPPLVSLFTKRSDPLLRVSVTSSFECSWEVSARGEADPLGAGQCRLQKGSFSFKIVLHRGHALSRGQTSLPQLFAVSQACTWRGTAVPALCLLPSSLAVLEVPAPPCPAFVLRAHLVTQGPLTSRPSRERVSSCLMPGHVGHRPRGRAQGLETG